MHAGTHVDHTLSARAVTAGPRVPWRYAVLSNMLLMFGAPPASGAAAQPLVRHCLQLLASDMLLLRQVGGAGLWLMLTATARQVQDSRRGGGGGQTRRGVEKQAVAGPAVLQKLKQVCSLAWCCCVRAELPLLRIL
jgi:hypothetical protein